MEAVLAAAALLYLRARNFDIQALYPHPTLRGTGLGLLLFMACWLAGDLTTAALATSGQRGVVDFSFEGVSLVVSAR